MERWTGEGERERERPQNTKEGAHVRTYLSCYHHIMTYIGKPEAGNARLIKAGSRVVL